MASRCRSLSRSSLSLLKSAVNKPTLKPNPIPSSRLSSRSSTFSRSFSPTGSLRMIKKISSFDCWVSSFRSIPQLGSLQSLLPLISTVSSARLTSCLGIDSRSSRSLSPGMLSSANPGV